MQPGKKAKTTLFQPVTGKAEDWVLTKTLQKTMDADPKLKHSHSVPTPSWLHPLQCCKGTLSDRPFFSISTDQSGHVTSSHLLCA